MRCITLLLIASLLILPGCGQQTGAYVAYSGLTMGTTYNVKLRLPGPDADREAIRREIQRLFDDTNQVMSTYLKDSELSRINNANHTDKIEISAEIFKVIQLAQKISRYTDGAFDITVGPLVNLWGFGPEPSTHSIPADDLIRQALARTGYQKLTLGTNPYTLQKSQPDLYLDLSGIAKGYGVDRIAGYLDSLGVADYMVEAGGEINARGLNDAGRPWRIGIEKPVSDQRQVERVIKLDDMGMATSGDYRNFFEINGKRYAHIIDPVTGWPVAHELVSVTILDPATARADALATGLTVMGPDKAFAFARDHGIAAMFIIRQADGFIEKYTGAFQSQLIAE